MITFDSFSNLPNLSSLKNFNPVSVLKTVVAVAAEWL